MLKQIFVQHYITSVQVIFVADTVVTYYCIYCNYYEYYLNRRYYRILCNPSNGHSQ